MSSNGYVKPGEDPPSMPPAPPSTACSGSSLEETLEQIADLLREAKEDREAAKGVRCSLCGVDAVYDEGDVCALCERDEAREDTARLRSENAQLRIERDDWKERYAEAYGRLAGALAERDEARRIAERLDEFRGIVLGACDDAPNPDPLPWENPSANAKVEAAHDEE